MQIPTVKIELYEKDKEQFAQELEEGLRTTRVAQVSGIDQSLVDELYNYMQENIFELSAEGLYVGKGFYRFQFELPPSENLNYSGVDDRDEITFGKDQLLEKLNAHLHGIGSKVASALNDKYESISSPSQTILIGYCKGTKMVSPTNRRKIVLPPHPDDTSITLATSASAPGLEGKINGRWVSLHPEPGHLFVWAGNRLYTRPEIKPLPHRVRYPSSERWSLLYV